VSLEHGKKIHNIDASIGNFLSKARQDELIGDGLIVKKPGIALVLVVADCIPAALYDPKSGQLAIIHAGRKGVEINILSEAVKMMGSVDSKDLVLISGPAISKESYKFDSKEGVDTDFWGSEFTMGEDGKYQMDIKAKFKSQALQLGLSENNISISEIDTFNSKDYFSHRRSMATGEPESRFAIIASVKPDKL
jgi:hypothetical protein